MDDDLLRDVVGRPLASAELSLASQTLTLRFLDGGPSAAYRLPWLSPSDPPPRGRPPLPVQRGAKIVSVEEDEDERLGVYTTRFRTDRGETISCEYRNSSNGPYGGWLQRIWRPAKEE